MARTEPSPFDCRRLMRDVQLGQVHRTDKGDWRVVISGGRRSKSRVSLMLVTWAETKGLVTVDGTGRWTLTPTGVTWLDPA